MTGWIYWQSEEELWTVGYCRGGTREPIADFGSDEAAARRVHWLNGGKDAQGAIEAVQLQAVVDHLQKRVSQLLAHIAELDTTVTP